MFYVLSKLLDVFFSPLFWCLLLLATALLRRDLRKLRLQALLGLALLYLCCLPPVGALLWHLGEADARDTSRPEVTYDAVIVLGGITSPTAAAGREDPALSDAVERVVRAQALYRAGRARRVLLSAGPLRGSSEARVLAELLVRWGVPREHLVLEERSVNTRTNALETAALARSLGLRRLLLVTSALHLPRAAGCFRAAGLEVDLAPTDWHSAQGRAWVGFSLRPDASSLAAVEAVSRELAGRLVYRALGYTR